MGKPLRVLVVEDSPDDAELMLRELHRAGYDVTAQRVQTPGAMRAALAGGPWDVILSDHSLPQFSAPAALRVLKESDLDIPFILVSGSIGEEAAVAAMQTGARDYIVKGNFARLAPAVERELGEATVRLEHRRAEVALRTSERRLAEAEQLAQLGNWEWHIPTNSMTWSDGLYQVLGVPRSGFPGTFEAFLALVHPDDRVLVQQTVERAKRTPQHFSFEHRVVRPDGVVRHMHARGTILCDEMGMPSRAVGTAQDITERRSLEDQFRQAQKMEAVGRLAGGVAHDFNNLLTVITSYAEFLLDDLAPEDPRRRDVEEIRNAGGSAAGLTRQLLAFSRQQVIQPQVLDLNDVVTNGEKLVKRVVGEDIEVVTAPGPELGGVKADPGQLEQVIMNLAVNARDAMPRGGKLTLETANVELDEVYVQGHPLAKPGQYVMLGVSDTGVGMDEQTQARVFEPFFTTKEAGTGLGLATVYGIVKQSGGLIRVYSEPGHGTSFKIYLPRVDEPAEELAASAVTADSLRGTETVLLAEDAAGLRVVARQVLERYGYRILEAPNGEAALRLAAKHHGLIHLLLTDVVMPERSGRQLAEDLAVVRPGVKVLYMSGYTDDAVVRHGVLEHGVSFLQKPFTPDALARKVRQVLDSPAPA